MVATEKRRWTGGLVKTLRDNLAYSAAIEQKVILQHRLKQLDKDIADAEACVAGAEAVSSLDAAALAVLKGTTDSAPDPDALRKTLDGLRADRRTIRRALELHEPAVLEAESRAAYEIRESLLDQHKALGRRIRDALIALRDALLAEVKFRNELDATGASFGSPLEAVAFMRVGCLGDDYWSIARWLKDTHEYLAGE